MFTPKAIATALEFARTGHSHGSMSHTIAAGFESLAQLTILLLRSDVFKETEGKPSPVEVDLREALRDYSARFIGPTPVEPTGTAQDATRAKHAARDPRTDQEAGEMLLAARDDLRKAALEIYGHETNTIARQLTAELNHRRAAYRFALTTLRATPLLGPGSLLEGWEKAIEILQMKATNP